MSGMKSNRPSRTSGPHPKGSTDNTAVNHALYPAVYVPLAGPSREGMKKCELFRRLRLLGGTKTVQRRNRGRQVGHKR